MARAAAGLSVSFAILGWTWGLDSACDWGSEARKAEISVLAKSKLQQRPSCSSLSRSVALGSRETMAVCRFDEGDPGVVTGEWLWGRERSRGRL